MRSVLLAALVACSSSASMPSEPHALGMNDVTILLPLPDDPTAPVLSGIFDHGNMVDPAWFDGMVFTRRDLGSKLQDPIYFNAKSFHIVAVRVDLCDRSVIGPCPAGVDGRLRLVAQPIYASDAGPAALDVGVHLFYPIPAAELSGVVDELRAIAAIRPVPDGALAVIAHDPEYLDRLRALVLRYATATNLVRFTANGQKDQSVGNSWLFRQLDRTPDGHSYTEALIPNAQAYQQEALLQSGDITYVSEQLTDVPAGFQYAVAGLAFRDGTAEQRAGAIDAIAAMENPTLHDTVDSQCLGCHVGSYIGPYRAGEAGIDLAASASWYVSPTHDLTVPPSDPTHLRGLGYFGTTPVISQRVANETANVLDEIAAQGLAASHL